MFAKKFKSLKRSQCGFSTVEFLVAFGILVFLAAGIGTVFNSVYSAKSSLDINSEIEEKIGLVRLSFIHKESSKQVLRDSPGNCDPFSTTADPITTDCPHCIYVGTSAAQLSSFDVGNACDGGNNSVLTSNPSNSTSTPLIPKKDVYVDQMKIVVLSPPMPEKNYVRYVMRLDIPIRGNSKMTAGGYTRSVYLHAEVPTMGLNTGKIVGSGAINKQNCGSLGLVNDPDTGNCVLPPTGNQDIPSDPSCDSPPGNCRVAYRFIGLSATSPVRLVRTCNLYCVRKDKGWSKGKL